MWLVKKARTHLQIGQDSFAVDGGHAVVDSNDKSIVNSIGKSDRPSEGCTAQGSNPQQEYGWATCHTKTSRYVHTGVSHRPSYRNHGNSSHNTLFTQHLSLGTVGLTPVLRLHCSLKHLYHARTTFSNWLLDNRSAGELASNPSGASQRTSETDGDGIGDCRRPHRVDWQAGGGRTRRLPKRAGSARRVISLQRHRAQCSGGVYRFDGAAWVTVRDGMGRDLNGKGWSPAPASGRDGPPCLYRSRPGRRGPGPMRIPAAWSRRFSGTRDLVSLAGDRTWMRTCAHVTFILRCAYTIVRRPNLHHIVLNGVLWYSCPLANLSCKSDVVKNNDISYGGENKKVHVKTTVNEFHAHYSCSKHIALLVYFVRGNLNDKPTLQIGNMEFPTMARQKARNLTWVKLA